MTDTERDTALRTAVSDGEGSEEVNAPNAYAHARGSVPNSAVSAVTERENRRGWWAAFRPPEPWQHRPSSLAAMSRYAWRGAWTGEPVRQVKDSDEAPWRTVRSDDTSEDLVGKPIRTRQPFSRVVGVWYFRLFAIPLTTVLHYAAWIVARPSRLIVAVGLWAVAMQVPGVRAVAEVLLPWSAWPWPWGGS